MTTTIVRLFDRHSDANHAIQNLVERGIPIDDVSIIASNADGWYRDGNDLSEGTSPVTGGAGAGAGIGGALGAGIGALVGLGFLAVPGLGPVVAAGWLASTAVGAAGGLVAGAATGGIIGALTADGVSESDAEVYAEGIRRGGAVLSVKVDDDFASKARAILDGSHPVDVKARRNEYLSQGWTTFDPNVPAPHATARPPEARIGSDLYR